MITGGRKKNLGKKKMTDITDVLVNLHIAFLWIENKSVHVRPHTVWVAYSLSQTSTGSEFCLSEKRALISVFRALISEWLLSVYVSLGDDIPVLSKYLGFIV